MRRARVASTKPAAARRPSGRSRIVWETTTYNWGRKVVNDERITGEFTYRNEGDADLRITKVKPSCGCTAVDYDEIVASGKSGRIRFSVDSRRVSSNVPKTIRVESKPGDGATFIVELPVVATTT